MVALKQEHLPAPKALCLCVCSCVCCKHACTCAEYYRKAYWVLCAPREKRGVSLWWSFWRPRNETRSCEYICSATTGHLFQSLLLSTPSCLKNWNRRKETQLPYLSLGKVLSCFLHSVLQQCSPWQQSSLCKISLDAAEHRKGKHNEKKYRLLCPATFALSNWNVCQ